MNIEVIGGILIPFVGTTLGAAGVFFMKKELSDLVQRALTGFAAGDFTQGQYALSGLCLRNHGGGFGMESSDSGDGSV